MVVVLARENVETAPGEQIELKSDNLPATDPVTYMFCLMPPAHVVTGLQILLFFGKLSFQREEGWGSTGCGGLGSPTARSRDQSRSACVLTSER